MKKIIFALFLLQIIKFEEIRKKCSYIIIYRLLCTIIYKQFFLIFSKFIIYKRNNVKIILLLIFLHFFIIIIIFLYQTWILLKKEGYMNINGHFIYNYICFYIYNK